MVINGAWWPFEDGIDRPAVQAWVLTGDGQRIRTRFLVDTGADCTAFAAPLLDLLGLPTRQPPGMTLRGVNGSSTFVVVTTALELPRHDGGVAVIRGDFTTLTDPQATDMSVLGRDVLNHFDVTTSRRRNQVVLIAGNHQYLVTP